VLAYIFVCVVMFFALWQTVRLSDEQDEQQKETAVARCELQRDGREGVRRTIVAIVEPPPGVTYGYQQQATYDRIIAILDHELPPIVCGPGGVAEVQPNGG
jgi:hypothetical protein